MLQQTQVDRVVPIFERFVAAYPSFDALAAASAGDVVRAWRGLGYNSRAVRLHALARTVCERHAGELPRESEALRALPGVGPYTLRAIRAFAFDCDEVAFDTNISRVLQRAMLGISGAGSAPAAALAQVASTLLPAGRGNEVNSALMDLGASVCTARAPKCLICPLATRCKSAPLPPARMRGAKRGARSVKRTERFEETTRYLRGRIVDALRALPSGKTISLLDLHAELATLVPRRTTSELAAASSALARDGVVTFDGERISLDNSEP